MPVTPFHFGPGVFLKSLFQKKFSLIIFILVQIFIDVETAWNIFRGNERLHTLFHTYLGSCIIIIVISIVGYWGQNLLKNKVILNFKTILLSAVIGAWSHVFLDSMMHIDVLPLYPLTVSNFMLQKISLLTLHLGCLLSGVIGIIIWLLRSR